MSVPLWARLTRGGGDRSAAASVSATVVCVRLAVIALAVVLVDLLVFGTGWLEMETVLLVYPTSGVVLGLLWRWGWRYWPAVALGSALTSWYFFGFVADDAGVVFTGWRLAALVLGTALPDALAAALGAYVAAAAWRASRSLPLSSLGAALRLSAAAVLIAPGVSTVTSGWLVWVLSGRPGAWWAYLQVWWVSQVLGNLIVAPALVVWGDARRPWATRRIGLWVLLLGVCAVCVLSFTPWALPVPAVFPLTLGLPLLVWSAIGWDVRGATAGLFAASWLALIGTAQGYGVLSTLMPLDKLDNLQWGLASLAVTLLVLGAVTAERARHRAALSSQRDRLRRLSRQIVETEHRERRDLATRLHDGMNQYLAAARLALEQAQFAEAPEVDKAAGALRQAEAEGRAVINELAPPTLTTLGLHAALSALVRKFEAEFDLPVLYAGDPAQVRPPEAVEAYLLRCARELLFNVVKHAHAGRAGIAYRSDASGVELVVWDDGVGFDVSAVLEDSQRGDASFGLYSIHEQAVSLGGDVTRHAGHYVGVKVWLPGYNQGGVGRGDAGVASGISDAAGPAPAAG